MASLRAIAEGRESRGLLAAAVRPKCSWVQRDTSGKAYQ
jgi:hypothetical protein